MVTKTDRREEILQAMLDLVVERGINDAPMSELSKRSGASAGVIYHYFSNKDDIINQLYFSIKARMISSLAQEVAVDMPVKQAFLQVWRNGYDFYRNHPSERKFLNQYENLPCYGHCEKPQSMLEDPAYLLLANFMKTKQEGGVLKNLPVDVLVELSVGVASRLAIHSEEYTDNVLGEVAETCWKSVVDDDFK